MMRIMDDGTQRALQPLADEVLQWVSLQRSGSPELRRPTPDELRRIELCALAVINLDRLVASMSPLEGTCPCGSSYSSPSPPS